MQDVMIYEGKEFELAKNNMKIARLIEKAEKSLTMIDAYKAELELVIAAAGSDVIDELLGSTNIEEVDLTTLVLIYNAVVDGYEKRIHDLEAQKEAKFLNSPSVKALKDAAGHVQILKSASRK